MAALSGLTFQSEIPDLNDPQDKNRRYEKNLSPSLLAYLKVHLGIK